VNVNSLDLKIIKEIKNYINSSLHLKMVFCFNFAPLEVEGEVGRCGLSVLEGI